MSDAVFAEREYPGGSIYQNWRSDPLKRSPKDTIPCLAPDSPYRGQAVDATEGVSGTRRSDHEMAIEIEILR